MTFFLVDCEIILSSKLHATGSAYELTVLGLMALLDVSPQSEPRVENLLAEVTLEVDIELAVYLMLVFDAAVHVSEGIVTHITGESSQQTVGHVVMCDGLVIFLKLSFTNQTVVHRHLIRGTQSHQTTAVHVVGVQLSFLQLHASREGGEAGEGGATTKEPNSF